MHLFASIVDSIEIQFPFLVHYKYLFLFISTFIQGLNSIILAGFSLSLRTVSFLPAVIICIVGDFFNGWAWYAVGYFGGAKPIDKWGRKDPKSRKVIETVERYFHRYSGRAIVFTKLTWSLTIATIVMAGSFKYDFKKFSWYNFLGGLGWVGITFTVGLLFGKGYRAVALVNNLGYIMLFLGSAILLIFAFKLIFRSKFIQSLTAMEHLMYLGDKVKDGIDKLLS